MLGSTKFSKATVMFSKFSPVAMYGGYSVIVPWYSTVSVNDSDSSPEFAFSKFIF